MAESLSALDLMLAQLRAGTVALGSVLLELDTDANRALLDPAVRSGETAARSRAVRGRLDWLWERHRDVSSLLAQADALRGEKPRLAARRAADLEVLLCEPALPARPAPPAPDGGPAGAVVAATPRELLAAADEVVEVVRSDLHLVVAAWTGAVGQLSDLDRRLAEVGAGAAQLGLAPLAEAVAARAELRALSSVVAADPLSVSAAHLAAVGDAVAAAESVLGSLERARLSLAGELAAAEALLAEIVTVVEAGDAAARRTRARVAGAARQLVRLGEGWFDGPSRGLRPWLDRISEASAAGDWQRAARGLLAWRPVAEETLAAAKQVAETNAAPLRRRGELRGLLGALRAKAAADGTAELAELEPVYAGAHDALYSAPVDLDRADELVRAYARAITERPAPAVRTAAGGAAPVPEGRAVPAEEGAPAPVPAAPAKPRERRPVVSDTSRPTTEVRRRVRRGAAADAAGHGVAAEPGPGGARPGSEASFLEAE